MEGVSGDPPLLPSTPKAVQPKSGSRIGRKERNTSKEGEARRARSASRSGDAADAVASSFGSCVSFGQSTPASAPKAVQPKSGSRIGRKKRKTSKRRGNQASTIRVAMAQLQGSDSRNSPFPRWPRNLSGDAPASERLGTIGLTPEPNPAACPDLELPRAQPVPRPCFHLRRGQRARPDPRRLSGQTLRGFRPQVGPRTHPWNRPVRPLRPRR